MNSHKENGPECPCGFFGYLKDEPNLEFLAEQIGPEKLMLGISLWLIDDTISCGAELNC